jgi:hypothetical protein
MLISICKFDLVDLLLFSADLNTSMILDALPAAFSALHWYFITDFSWLSSRKKDFSVKFWLFSQQVGVLHEYQVYFTSAGLLLFNEQLIISPSLNLYNVCILISGFTVKKWKYNETLFTEVEVSTARI